MSTETATANALNAPTLHDPSTRNNAPCAACKHQHKKCEGGYPYERCKLDVHKAITCTRSSQARLDNGATEPNDRHSIDNQIVIGDPSVTGLQWFSYDGPQEMFTANNPVMPQASALVPPTRYYAPSAENAQAYTFSVADHLRNDGPPAFGTSNAFAQGAHATPNNDAFDHASTPDVFAGPLEPDVQSSILPQTSNAFRVPAGRDKSGYPAPWAYNSEF